LYLIHHHLPFKSVASDRLFYDHWQYCVHFRLDEVSALRESLDRATIDELLNRRQQWRERVRQRWPHNNFVRGHDAITDVVRTNLYDFAEFLSLTTEPYKMVITVDHCRIYSNSTNLLERIGRLPFIHNPGYSRAQVTRARNTIALRNPQYQLRSYFRNIKLNSEEKTQIINFLNQQEIRMSPALQEWINSPFNRTQDYFFVDHDSESWLTMLSLVSPGIIRKTMHIIPDK
jgi:hypothetical protein